MKLSFSKVKFEKTVRSIWKMFPIISVLLIMVIFLIMTYIVITPREDADVKAAGDAEVQSLNINFNKKLLDQLAGTTQTPTVNESGGRDPFSPM